MKLRIGFFLMFSFFSGLLLAAGAESNLLKLNTGRPEHWAEPATSVSFTDGIVKIVSSTPADSAWSVIVPVNPNAVYKLSGKIKTENVVKKTGLGALLNVHQLNTKTEAVSGSSDWTEVSTEITTDGQTELMVNCLFGGYGTAVGTAYYKDVTLELVKVLPTPNPIPENWNPTIVLDAQKKGTEISPYIYGQFIEHLGRCIYGGIWSEMLEDRKFHDAVGSETSPWKPIPDCAVEMNKTDAFVGEWTPECSAADVPIWKGVVQNKLAFEKGRKYVGYAWVKPGAEIDKIEVRFYGSNDRKLGKTFAFPVTPNVYSKIEFEIESPVDCENTELEVEAFGKGTFSVGCVSLMPADNIHGMRADTLALLKELNAPVYRWPGGNFVSGYDWKDGIGDRDKRPPRRNPAWQGIEHNDFGMDEFIVLCRYLGTEPYIAVNTGAGQVENALKELEYANGSADTPMGQRRASNGNPEPYKVKFWGIGNEMYGSWQIGHMPVQDYVKKHIEFYNAFKAFDKDLFCIGVGAAGGWNDVFIPGTFNKNDALSEHIYAQKRGNVVDHVRLVANSIDRVAGAHREYRKKWANLYAQKDLQIVMDEWNYWYGPTPFGEVGTRYFQKDGLGIAAGLHAFYRNSDLFFMANYAQTVNVIGCLKTSKTHAKLESTGLVLKLYRAEFGNTPISAEIQSDAEYKAGALDVSAALTADGKFLTVAFVNAAPTAVKATLKLNGLELQTCGKRFVIAESENNPDGYNDPDQPDRITIVESDVQLTNQTVEAAPMAVTLLKFPVK